MKTARYTYRCYPTTAQAHVLARTMGCARFVYNWALATQREARRAGLKPPTIPTLDRALTTLKKTPEHTWLAEVSCVPLQQALRDLGCAWSNFFAKRAKAPSFKKKQAKQSIRYTQRGFTLKGRSLTLGKIEAPLNIRWSRALPSEPTSCTVTRDAAGRYFVSFVVELEPQTLPSVDKVVGIDLGLTHFAALSDGQKIDNPRHLQHDLARLAKAQRALAKKQRGSKNRHKARRKVARIQARIADKRADFLHKLSTRLVRENQALAVESLNVSGMLRNRRLSRAISDAGWGQFLAMLAYKCAWFGRELRAIDRWFPSSKTCSGCAHRLDALDLSVRAWTCPKCEADHDRDVNAAINIAKAAGLAVFAYGERTAGHGEQLALFAQSKSSRCAEPNARTK